MASSNKSWQRVCLHPQGHELKQGLHVWSSLPIPVSDNLINSMGNRCRQCIQIVAHSVQWLVTLTAVTQGPGLNPGEDMKVCKCIAHLRHEGTLNSLRAASPLMMLVEGEKRWESPDHLQRALPQN
ncbi:hypothetical protein TNCV_187381 [Trichonephila clavipes]|nr:hypothetical protein TNCV_187381 [Trichonephila clavipes]